MVEAKGMEKTSKTMHMEHIFTFCILKNTQLIEFICLFSRIDLSSNFPINLPGPFVSFKPLKNSKFLSYRTDGTLFSAQS